jgi:ATP-dependent RNA helicase DeaD
MNTDGFESLGLTRKTLKGIQEAGYESPTPIQGQAIPILMSGADLIAEAQTGTGKTAAFALPILERLQASRKSPQALILCPTRELALQVSEAIYVLSQTPELRVLPVYGGQPIDRQLHALRAGVSIVVGTPGRLLDHIRRKTLKLDGVSMVVLDEADEMLAMGFIDDIGLIFDELPETRQIALFSATMPAPIIRLAGKYLRNAQKVTIASKPHTIPRIRQSYYEVSRHQKVDALSRILDMETPGPTIIFCNTKRESDMLGDHLRGRGYKADTLHGDLTQPARDKVMRRFRDGQVDVLVATDVAARGLDIKSVTHVINYDVPWDAESYTHRIGRTGRAGREGDAITLVSARELRQLKTIEKNTQAKIRPVRLPTTADIAVRRREVFKQELLASLEEGAFEQFLITVDELTENYGPSEVAAAALKLLWEQKNTFVPKPSVEDSKAAPAAEPGKVRLFITAGRRNGVRPGDLVGAIANEVGLRGNQIGAIDILEDSSFFEVPADKARDVITALKSTRIRGVRIEVGEAPGNFKIPADPRPQLERKKIKKKHRGSQ